MPSKTRAARSSKARGAAKPKKAVAGGRRREKAAGETAGPKLVVKQVKSGIGHAQVYKRTLRALGLRHHQAEIVVSDNPSIRGMLYKVHHLVTVRPQET